MKKALVIVLALIMSFGVIACGGDKDNGVKEYTYNSYGPATPDTWNVHTWKTAADSEILTFSEMGLYDFVLNSTKDGYDIVPEMAAADPVDVTSVYAGNSDYGVPANAKKGYAYKIALNQNAVWENGDPINADTYVDSMKKILDPDMLNRRADSYYSDSLVIANAEAYLKQNSYEYKTVATFIPPVNPDDKEDEGSYVYADVADDKMYLNFDKIPPFFGANTPREFYEASPMYVEFFTVDGVDVFKKVTEIAANSRGGYVKLTDELKTLIIAVSKNFGVEDPLSYKQWTFYQDGSKSSLAFDKVGIKKTGEYEIHLITTKPINDFFIRYTLSSNWIVHKKTYEDGTKVVSEDGFKRTTYGTKKESYMSYGPYRLTNFQDGKFYELKKNDKWYGYADGKHENQFMTTKIVNTVVQTDETALQMFEKGELDTVTLGSDSMEKYKASKHLYITPDSYSASITLNTDFNKLKARQTEGKNKTIMANKTFRKGISLAVDRKAYVKKINPVADVGFGLVNYMYTADVNSGKIYREYDAAKEALVNLQELEYGAGKEYATLDEAYKAITGYNPTKAKELMIQAYDEELAAGNIKESDIITLEFAVYTTSDGENGWSMWASLFESDIIKTLKGTKLENKFKIEIKGDQQYTDTMRAGSTDIIRDMWGGNSMNPFSLLQVYLDKEIRSNNSLDGDTVMLTVNINGADKTKSLNDWFDCLNGLCTNGCEDNYAEADGELRVKILAAMESRYLSEYTHIPFYFRTIASLNSKKINEGADAYVNLVGFGGIRFMTYNYTDAEWSNFIKDRNNLNYQ